MNLNSNRLILSESQFKETLIKLKQDEKSKKQKNHFLDYKNFKSLKSFEMNNKPQYLTEALDKHISLSRKTGLSKRLLSKQNLEVNDTYQDTALLYSAVTTELIEDEALKNLINNDGEIQVGRIIYKISPFGTLYTEAKNELELEKVNDLMAETNDISIRVLEPSSDLNFSNIIKQPTEQLDVYLLNNKVYFIDTFKETHSVNEETIIGNINNDSTKISALNLYKNSKQTLDTSPTRDPIAPQNPLTPRPTRPLIPENPFAEMDTYTLNFRNGAGGVWDTYFTNQTKYKYFDAKYRISVLFYNRNYAITKSLGVKVKLQNKDGFGGIVQWLKK